MKFAQIAAFAGAIALFNVGLILVAPDHPLRSFHPDTRFGISLIGKLISALGTVLAFEFVYRFFKPAVDPMSIKVDHRIAQRRRNFWIGLPLVVIGSVIAFLADMKLIG